MRDRAIVIAGTHSGCGKTTVTTGIIGALRAKGKSVQPWKAGPDYIDPGFLGKAAGRHCRNLDSMILDEDTLREIFQSRKEEISIVEGVMGLYDSAGPFDERGSAAHLSKVLGLPVILVIDGAAVARSAAATALGFIHFDKEVNIAGFLVNRVGSEGHYNILKQSIEGTTGNPVLGYLKRDESLNLPERHLGLDLDLAGEKQDLILGKIAQAVSETIDLDALWSLAEIESPSEAQMPKLFCPETRKESFVKIAVARDEAFRFYYEDNLDILRHRGAEIVYFSPLRDNNLPNDVDAIYLGGGYPELYGPRLSSNTFLLEEIRKVAEVGIPIYGECGGFMYLTEEIVNGDGDVFPMVGLLPGRAVLGEKIRSLGYCSSELKVDSIVGEKGTCARGHVFHWSRLEGYDESEPKAFKVEKGEKVHEEGFQRGTVLGSWIHHHFASNLQMAESLIASAYQYQNQRRNDQPV